MTDSPDKRATRRPSWARPAGVIAAVVCAALLIVGASRSPTVSSRRLAETWADAHAATLPSSLSAITKYPMVYRKAILHHLSASQQQEMWREQIAAFLLAPHERSEVQTAIVRDRAFEVSALQRLVLLTVLDSIGSVFREHASIEVRRAAAKRICDMVHKAFTAQQVASLLAILGPRDALSSDAKATRSTTSSLSVSKNTSSCECSIGSYCECVQENPDGTRTPMCASGNCTPDYPDGCGCFMIWACDGACTLHPGG